MNKSVFITGASYGIGFALASAFAEAGAKIVFNDINQDFVDRGLAAYKEKGNRTETPLCNFHSKSIPFIIEGSDDLFHFLC